MELLKKQATERTTYLKATKILDFNTPIIQQLVEDRGWRAMNTVQAVGSIYDFVRDEILFGYNTDDAISASQVLTDGYGQCNTKANLFMALLRSAGIPNRIHGFTINKALQKGAITGIWYQLAPENILHSWVEVLVGDEWFNLEGIIVDRPFLSALQSKFSDCKTTFCGYGVYTDSFQNPQINWQLNHTYIQEKGINQDFGVFATPDEFYRKHQQKLGRFKKWIYQNLVRHLMNKNVASIRESTTWMYFHLYFVNI